MKKAIPLLFVLMLLFVFSGTVLAADDSRDKAPDDPQVRYTYINSTSIGFEINGSGLATMNASLWGAAGVDRVRMSIYLQKYDSGWSTERHYSAESYSDYVAWGATRYVASGYTYRLLVYYYAYDGDNSESTSMSLCDTY